MCAILDDFSVPSGRQRDKLVCRSSGDSGCSCFEDRHGGGKTLIQ